MRANKIRKLICIRRGCYVSLSLCQLVTVSIKKIQAELHDITAFKDSKIPWQPYSSTLMAIHTCQVNGRKRMQRAMIGGIRSWDTTVLPSVFPDNSYKQHIYVIDQVCGQHGLVLAELLFFWAFPWTETYCPLFSYCPRLPAV